MSDEPEKKEGAGVPAWVMTFADLMTLLMCFFVLLLSFAEMDLIKFKQVAGSMKQAFGVQKIVPSDRTEATKDFLDGQTSDEPLFEKVGDLDAIDPKALAKLLEEMQAEQVEAEALKLAALLSEEIAAGAIELETTSDSVIVRISEKASFPSGRSKLRPAFVTVLDKIQSALVEVQGTVTVAGHTDNIPINTRRFRSNWELSAGRAVSVVHALLRSKTLDPGRFLVEGHGDARPLVANDTAENRAINRRVELTIVLKKVAVESITEDGEGEAVEGENEALEEAAATATEGAASTDEEGGAEELESTDSDSDEVAPPDEGAVTIDSEDSKPSVDSASDVDEESSQPEDAGSLKQEPPIPRSEVTPEEPAGLEVELPGSDIILPGFEGGPGTPEELELLLQALDAITSEPSLEE